MITNPTCQCLKAPRKREFVVLSTWAQPGHTKVNELWKGSLWQWNKKSWKEAFNFFYPQQPAQYVPQCALLRCIMKINAQNVNILSPCAHPHSWLSRHVVCRRTFILWWWKWCSSESQSELKWQRLWHIQQHFPVKIFKWLRDILTTTMVFFPLVRLLVATLTFHLIYY